MSLRISRELLDTLKELSDENQQLFRKSSTSDTDIMVLLLEILRYLGLAKVSLEKDGTLNYEPTKEHAPLILTDESHVNTNPSMGEFLQKVDLVVTEKMDMFDFETYLAESFFDQGRLEETIVTLEMLEKVYMKNTSSRMLGRFERLVGAIHFLKGQIAEAKSHFERSKTLCEDTGDTEGLAFAYLALANLEGNKNNIQEAEVLYDRAYVLFREVESEKGMAKVKVNLSYLYSRNGMLKESTRLAFESIQILTKLKDINTLQYAFLNRSVLLASHGDYRETFENVNNAYYMSQQTSNSRVLHLSSLQEIEMDIITKRRKIPLEAIERSINFFKENELTQDLILAYCVLTEYYITKGEAQKVIESAHLMIGTSLSIEDYAGLVAAGARIMRASIIFMLDDDTIKSINKMVRKGLSDKRFSNMYLGLVTPFYPYN